MKKGFTLIEVIAAIAIIMILVLAIGTLNTSNIKMNRHTVQRDEEFSIAKAVCEKYKSDGMDVDTKDVVIYIDNLEDMYQQVEDAGGFINNLIINSPSVIDTSLNSLKAGSSGKKFALLLQGKAETEFNILKVTVLSMGSDGSNVTLKAIN